MSETVPAHQPAQEPWWAPFLTAEVPPRPAGTPSSGESTFDAVVVGSGMAGHVAAIFLQDQGRSVVMLDAAPEGGGTTYKSGAGMWIPDNALRRARGLPEQKAWALDKMARLAHPESYDPDAPRLGMDELAWELMTTFYARSGGVMDELQRVGLGLMEFPSFTGDYPAMLDYHNEIERGDGMHLSPTQLDGEWGLGWHLIDRLHAIASERGIELRVRHRVTGVLQNADGEVIGVRAQTPDGEVELHARRGVVFASGGYAHNRELTDRFFPATLYGSCAVKTGQGDFITIAEELGAQLGNMGRGWGTQHPVEFMLRDSEVIDHVAGGRNDSSLMVNAAGRRVVNEKLIYHERSQVHWEPGEDGSFPNHLLFEIYDDFVAHLDVPQLHRWPDHKPADDHYWVISGQTVAELAERIDARLAEYGDAIRGVRLAPGFAAELTRTIERFNAMARAGVDEDFHRGETTLELDWNGASHPDNDGNPTMYPLADGPYHCIILAGSVLDTNGGPVADPDGRILRPDGTAIPGLYGAGNCVAAAAGAGYWSGGSTLGPAATFAYLAAQAVAAAPVRDQQKASA